jgi:UDP-N-acetylglucosamine 2-epimerase (non-hydrolysing)/GDP/UDP-N,N'-diacetylbacillosamine 2-epimerase (hydrolysing)
MKIAIATSTRADWGLLSPLAGALSDTQGVDLLIYATNMHLRQEMGLTYQEIEKDGYQITKKIPTEGERSDILAQTIVGFSQALQENQPDAIIILGDRFEMLGVAQAALLQGVPIIHIAGGTISEGAIDDNIRHAITKLSNLHLTETELCRQRVIQMGEEPSSVYTTGAIGVYNLFNITPLSKKELQDDLGINFDRDTYIVTLHPSTLSPISPAQEMQNMLAALSDQSMADCNFIFTYPNNDCDPTPQIKQMQDFCLNHKSNSILLTSLGRVRYLSALQYAAGVIGNSSSGIVEVASAGIPTLDIGERQKGRETAPSVIHTASDKGSILHGLQLIRSKEVHDMAAKRENPYFRPNTLQIMTEAILNFSFTRYPQKKFHRISLH